jgi:hydrogenase expression/formation protein HypE
MKITLAYGGGGEETNKLINELFYKYFDNDILKNAEDAAVLNMDKKIAFTTDSFTVSPLFFNGGNIGKLSIAGTCNDVAMMGAKPEYLTCSL